MDTIVLAAEMADITGWIFYGLLILFGLKILSNFVD